MAGYWKTVAPVLDLISNPVTLLGKVVVSRMISGRRAVDRERIGDNGIGLPIRDVQERNRLAVDNGTSACGSFGSRPSCRDTWTPPRGPNALPKIVMISPGETAESVPPVTTNVPLGVTRKFFGISVVVRLHS
jgi:hypothetical protein